MVNQTTPKGDARAKLDAIGIEAICAKIIEDEGYRRIASDAGVGLASLVDWLAADPERAARAREARTASSDVNDEMGLEGLEALGPNSTPSEVARAREIASHRRWRARTRDPKRFCEKLDIDASVKVDAMSELFSYLAANARGLPIGLETTDESKES